MKLLGIARVSTESQAGDEKMGYARQGTTISEVARRLGCPDIEVVRVCVSGTSLDLSSEWKERVAPRLADLDGIVVDHQDRLIRSDLLTENAGALIALRDAGVRIHTPSGELDLNDPQHAMVAAILAAVAGYERHRIRARSDAAKLEHARAGRYPEAECNLGLGLAYDRDSHTWSTTEDAETVRHAFRLYCEGMGLAKIARIVGHPMSTVLFWMGSQLYGGVLFYKGITTRVMGGPGQPEAVIDAETWERAQRRRAGASKGFRSGRTDRADVFPYSGVLQVRPEPAPGLTTWATPAPAITMRGKQDAGGPRYWCVGGVIASPMASAVNQGVDRYLADLSRDVSLADAVIGAAQPREDTARAAVETARAELAIADEKLRRLADLYIDGGITREHHKARAAKLDRERTQAEARLADAEEALGAPSAEDVAEVVAGLQAFDRSWDGVAKREWLRRFIHGITISHERVHHCTIRIPGALAPTFVGGPSRTWDELGVPNPWDADACRTAETGLCTTSQAAKDLGVAANTLAGWARKGLVPRPANVLARGKAPARLRWTMAEVEAARQAIEAREARKARKPRRAS